MALYYISIPLLGPKFAEICKGHVEQGEAKCEYWDVVTSHILAAIYFIDGNEGFFTFLTGVFVAWFTGVLWVATDRLWRAGERQASLARDEFIATHRPLIAVRGLYLFSASEYALGDQSRKTMASFDIANVGSSPATVVEIDVAIICRMGRDGLDFIFPLFEVPHLFVPFSIDAGFRVEWTGFTNDFVFSEFYESKKPELDFRGTVSYLDRAGRRRQSAFHRAYDFSRNRFIVADDPDMNYTD